MVNNSVLASVVSEEMKASFKARWEALTETERVSILGRIESMDEAEKARIDAALIAKLNEGLEARHATTIPTPFDWKWIMIIGGLMAAAYFMKSDKGKKAG